MTGRDGAGDVRILERLAPIDRRGPISHLEGILQGCALDVETTGLDRTADRIVELALQRFWADAGGRIVATGRRFSWLEDPGIPITPEVTAITGIRQEDVRGRSITDPEAASLIRDADFVVAHNASFDRPFVERRLPLAAGRPWVCTLTDVDWRGLGFEGRTLSHLLTQMGWFYQAHRAQVDVDALLHLLDHPVGSGTVLRHAVTRASRATWRVDAAGAPFAAGALLRARGYHWDARARHWWMEVEEEVVDDEVGWLAARVHEGRRRPVPRRVTWRERHAA